MTKHAFWTASFQCLAKSLPTDLSLGRLYRVCIFALKTYSNLAPRVFFHLFRRVRGDK